MARAQDRARFKLGIDSTEAPLYFDCSSFTQWIFRQFDVELPRHSVDQRETGYPVAFEERRLGDLIFRTGYRHNWVASDGESVGHVGIVSSEGMIIHATNGGVCEEVLEAFLISPDRFRGIRRVLSER